MKRLAKTLVGITMLLVLAVLPARAGGSGAEEEVKIGWLINKAQSAVDEVRDSWDPPPPPLMESLGSSRR